MHEDIIPQAYCGARHSIYRFAAISARQAGKDRHHLSLPATQVHLIARSVMNPPNTSYLAAARPVRSRMTKLTVKPGPRAAIKYNPAAPFFSA